MSEEELIIRPVLGHRARAFQNDIYFTGMITLLLMPLLRDNSRPALEGGTIAGKVRNAEWLPAVNVRIASGL